MTIFRQMTWRLSVPPLTASGRQNGDHRAPLPFFGPLQLSTENGFASTRQSWQVTVSHNGIRRARFWRDDRAVDTGDNRASQYNLLDRELRLGHPA